MGECALLKNFVELKSFVYWTNSLKFLFNLDRTIKWSLRRICEHASSAFIFASSSSDQICLASSVHLRKFLSDDEERALGKLTHATDNNCIAKTTNFHLCLPVIEWKRFNAMSNDTSFGGFHDLTNCPVQSQYSSDKLWMSNNKSNILRVIMILDYFLPSRVPFAKISFACPIFNRIT